MRAAPDVHIDELAATLATTLPSGVVRSPCAKATTLAPLVPRATKNGLRSPIARRNAALPVGTTRFTVTGMLVCGDVPRAADPAAGIPWAVDGNDDPPRQAASARHAPAISDERANNRALKD